VHVCLLVVSAQLARVGVSEERWRSFRQLAVRRGLSVTAYLGKLVDAELARHARTELASVGCHPAPRDEAIAALNEGRARSMSSTMSPAGSPDRRLRMAAPGRTSARASSSMATSLDGSTAQREHRRPRCPMTADSCKPGTTARPLRRRVLPRVLPARG